MTFKTLTGVALCCVISTAAFADCNNGNLAANCDFDTDISGWNLVFGQNLVWNSTDGRDNPGSLQLESNAGSMFSTMSVQRCADITGMGGIDVETRAAFRVVAGAVSDSCAIQIAEGTDSACASLGSLGANGAADAATSSWTTVNGARTLAAGTNSLLVRLLCTNTTGDTSAFTVRFDDAVVREAGTPVDLQSFGID